LHDENPFLQFCSVFGGTQTRRTPPIMPDEPEICQGGVLSRRLTPTQNLRGSAALNARTTVNGGVGIKRLQIRLETVFSLASNVYHGRIFPWKNVPDRSCPANVERSREK